MPTGSGVHSVSKICFELILKMISTGCVSLWKVINNHSGGYQVWCVKGKSVYGVHHKRWVIQRSIISAF